MVVGGCGWLVWVFQLWVGWLVVIFCLAVEAVDGEDQELPRHVARRSSGEALVWLVVGVLVVVE